MENSQYGVDGFLKSSKIMRSPLNNVPLSERDQRALNRRIAQDMLCEENPNISNNGVNVHPPLINSNVNTMEHSDMYDKSHHIPMDDRTEDAEDLIMLSEGNAFSSTTIPQCSNISLEPEIVHRNNQISQNEMQMSSASIVPPQNMQSKSKTILPLTERNLSRLSEGSRSHISNATSRDSRQSEYNLRLHEIQKKRINIEEQAMQRRLDEEERFLKSQFESFNTNRSQQSRVRKFTNQLNNTWTYVQSQSNQTMTESPDPFEYVSSDISEVEFVRNQPVIPPQTTQQPTHSQSKSQLPTYSIQNPPSANAILDRNDVGFITQPINNDLQNIRTVPHLQLNSHVYFENSQQLPPSSIKNVLPQRLVPPGCLPSSDILQLNKKQRFINSLPPIQINNAAKNRKAPMNSTYISSPDVPQNRFVEIGTAHSSRQTKYHIPSHVFLPETINATNVPLSSTLMPISSTTSTVNRTLTNEELAARQAIAKDLPKFSGNVDEWPLFIVNFNQSTSRCNFSDAENLIRLQKSLHGKALESVRGFLMVPETVPMVMDTLQTLFGRPEQIIKSLQKKLRSEAMLKQERLDLLVQFALSLQNYCAIVSATGLNAYLNDPMLLDDLVMKLPPQTRLDWSIYSNRTGENNLTTFSQWLYNLAKCASRVLPSPVANSYEERRVSRQQPNKNHVHQTLHFHETTKNNNYPRETKNEIAPSTHLKCIVCEGDHKMVNCDKFTNLTVPERWEMAKSKKVCFRCLKHTIKYPCYSEERCMVGHCRLRHHKLLHNPSRQSSNQNSTIFKDNTTENSDAVISVHRDVFTNRKTLFRIIPVEIINNGIVIKTHAFIDEGSSSTLVDHRLANALTLDGPKQELCIKWTNDVSRVEQSSKVVSFEIKGCFIGAKSFRVAGARTVENLNLPFQSFEFNENNSEFHDLPIQQYNNVRPDILIGLEHLACPLEVRQNNCSNLIASKSKLGWSVYGGSSTSTQIFHVCDCEFNPVTHDLVKNYFSLESFGISPTIKPIEPVADIKAKEIMKRTTRRVNDRYEVGLLWKHDPIKLPNSYEMALRKWKCTEKKMARDPIIYEFIHGKICDYFEKEYIRKMKPNEMFFNGPIWYIPIFVVNNSNKNKPRLVWDCAATVDGVSLNSCLMSGPDMVKELPGILLRFRNKRIALCGDIREMFHQIKVIQKDQQSQRFLYRKNPSEPIEIYIMQVLTFGATCSPTLSQHVKNYHALQYIESHKEAVTAIIHNTYVDDWLQCADTEDEMIELAKSVTKIYREGGFEIRGWMSNSKFVLDQIGDANTGHKPMNMSEDKAEKVLGLWWIPETDEFTFQLNPRKFGEDLLQGKTPTKREVLRVVMAVFDPLGFVANVMVYAKIVLREIWHSGVEWDEQILPEQNEMWKLWLSVVKSIESLRIPRYYGLSGDEVKHEMHVFVDASTNAFGAVCYLRTVCGDQVNCTLMGAKSRIAPQKPMSIPRLELMGAVLGARISESFTSLCDLNICNIVFWCDSENVLRWINSNARNYRQFVALRIGEIFEITNTNQWRWIGSKDNVADEITKWTTPPKADFQSRWYSGPKFLLLSPSEWPKSEFQPADEDEKCDVERIHFVKVDDENKVFLNIVPDIARFSSWKRLVRTTARINRFLLIMLSTKYKNTKDFIQKGPIAFNEFTQAEYTLIRFIQRECYGEEIVRLLKGKTIDQKSTIFSCCPYLDEYQILRVFGRIDASIDVPIDTKRPIILPDIHEATFILVMSFHLKHYHQMHEVVISELRRRFWIPKIRSVLVKVRQHCSGCKLRNTIPIPPQMGMLPAARMTTFSPAFTHTGLDFFGPMEVVVGRRIEKRWGALFTCLTTRAVYIETTPSLSTDSCLMIVSNFMSRRGVPSDMYTDQGTNFRGLNNLLMEEMKKMSPDELMERVNFRWHFLPPASPHMGGAWERMIKSTKNILTEIIPQRRPTDEVLRCALIEVEGILNKRPLTHVPLDSPDQDPLTPNHLMMLCNGGTKPFNFEVDDGLSLHNNYKKAVKIANDFWTRWVREYLPTLTRRAKWFENPGKQIELEDVVIIVDERAPKNTWLKGIVIAVHTGKDGTIRSADVKTKCGVYTRPVVKLAILDVREVSKPMGLTRGSVTNKA